MGCRKRPVSWNGLITEVARTCEKLTESLATNINQLQGLDWENKERK